MADEDIRGLAERLLVDEDLRERWRQGPADVMQEHGIEVTDEMARKLSLGDWPGKSDAWCIELFSDHEMFAMWW
jgi:hypothetical protein